ncbi:hypothetical protein Dimus_007229 [Dionaea muscipula]
MSTREKEPNVPSLPDNWDQVMKIENMVCLFMDDPSVIKVYVADTLNLSLYHMVDFNYKHPVCTTFGVARHAHGSSSSAGYTTYRGGGGVTGLIGKVIFRRKVYVYNFSPDALSQSQNQPTWILGPKLLCPKPKPFVAALENRIYALTSSGHWYEHHFEVLDLNITGAGQEAHWEGLPGLDENARRSSSFICHGQGEEDHYSCRRISRLALPSSRAPREVLLGKSFRFTDRSSYLWMIDSDSDSYSPIHEFSEGILGELVEIFDRYKSDDYYMSLEFMTRTSSDDDDGNLFLAVSLSCSLLDRKTPAEYARNKHILCLAGFRLVVKDDGGGYCISRLVKDEPRINFFRMEEQKGCDFDGYSRV